MKIALIAAANAQRSQIFPPHLMEQLPNVAIWW